MLLLFLKLTSRPFFFTQALSPSTFQEVIFMLALRPSLLVILSGGSSYIIGASGSLAFFVFFAEAVKEMYKVMKVAGPTCFSKENVFNSCFICREQYVFDYALVHAVVPEPVSFSPSAAASSAFLPLFILELARTANTPRRHTTRTHNSTRAAGKTEGI